MSDGLSLSHSAGEAEKARRDYRLAIGLAMLVDAAMGLLLLVCPSGVSALLLIGEPGTTDWTWARVAGALVLVILAFLWAGRDHPNRAKLINMIGIVGRLLVGIALILIGSGSSLMWVGLFEIAIALALARFYYRFFAALVMSRP